MGVERVSATAGAVAGVVGRGRARHVAAAAVGAAVLVAHAAPRVGAPEPHHPPHHQQLRLQQPAVRCAPTPTTARPTRAQYVRTFTFLSWLRFPFALSLCFRHPLCLFKHRLSTFGRSVRRRRVRPRLFRTGARYTVRLVLYGRDRVRFIKNLSDRRSLKSRFV